MLCIEGNPDPGVAQAHLKSLEGLQVCLLLGDEGPHLVDLALRLRPALVAVLEDGGYRVLPCGRPSQALAALETGAAAASAAVLDVGLPEMDGVELMGRLHGRAPELPVIFMTGRGDFETVVGALRRGAEDFLKKPIAPEQLCSAVERVLERRRVRAERDALVERTARYNDFLLGVYRISLELVAAPEHGKVGGPPCQPVRIGRPRGAAPTASGLPFMRRNGLYTKLRGGRASWWEKTMAEMPSEQESWRDPIVAQVRRSPGAFLSIRPVPLPGGTRLGLVLYPQECKLTVKNRPPACRLHWVR